jgi:hypothetical protein
VIAPDARRLGGVPTLDDDHIYPAPSKVYGERQSDRTGPDDQHFSFD